MALSKKKEQQYLAKVKVDGMYLKRIKTNQTEAMCLEAVKRNGLALKYAMYQTEDICLAAVRENGYALQHVKEQTPKICLEAIRENSSVFEYAKHQTEEICWEAVKGYGWALEYVREKTPKLCFEAVKQNGSALQFAEEQTEEMCLAALFNEFYFYSNIWSPTKEMKLINAIHKEHKVKPYRQVRSELASKEIDLKDSPYHVLEQLYGY